MKLQYAYLVNALIKRVISKGLLVSENSEHLRVFLGPFRLMIRVRLDVTKKKAIICIFALLPKGLWVKI